MYGEVCLSGMCAAVRGDADIHASAVPQKLFARCHSERGLQGNNPPSAWRPVWLDVWVASALHRRRAFVLQVCHLKDGSEPNWGRASGIKMRGTESVVTLALPPVVVDVNTRANPPGGL